MPTKTHQLQISLFTQPCSPHNLTSLLHFRLTGCPFVPVSLNATRGGGGVKSQAQHVPGETCSSEWLISKSMGERVFAAAAAVLMVNEKV